MTFWLIVHLFTADGQFMAKDIYETASKEQCVVFAGEVARTVVNTNLHVQFNCISDEDYRLEQGDPR